MLLAALFLGACAPSVILLTDEPPSHPSVTSTPQSTNDILPTAAARTPMPTPTRTSDVGARADDLKGVEVRLWHGWDGSTARLLEQMAAEFNISNPWGITITPVSLQNFTLLGAEMEKIPAEQGEMVIALPEQILAWQNRVTDLNPYLSLPDLGFNPADLSAFAAQSNLGEARLGLPAARSAWFIFYNRSFARDLGFADAPQSAEDFKAQACAANMFWKQDQDLTNDGFGGLALEVSPNWQSAHAWLSAGGGETFENNEFHFDTPANISALEFVDSLRQQDCAWLPDSTTNFDNLASRRAIFSTGNLSEITLQSAAFAASGSTDEWTLLPFPGNHPGITAYGPDYAILKTDPAHQLAAWLFIRWMLEPQNQVRWSVDTGLLPVTLPAITMFQAETASVPQWKIALSLIPQSLPYPQTAGWRKANKVLADGIFAYFRAYPNASLPDVLDMMDATVHDLIQ